MTKENIYALEIEGGGVAIMQLLMDVKVEAEIARLPYKVLGHRKITRKDIPLDRTFRNAWGHDLKVDMPRARDVARNILRERRAPKLAELDLDYRRAKDGEKQKVEERAQRLRDWPGRIELENAKTPAKLLEAVEAIASED